MFQEKKKYFTICKLKLIRKKEKSRILIGFFNFRKNSPSHPGISSSSQLRLITKKSTFFKENFPLLGIS